MPPSDWEDAKLLQVHLCTSDRYRGQPLYEAVVAKCRELGIAGATAICGREGFGSTGDIRRAPVAVTVVDSEANIARLAFALEAMLDKAVLFIEDVRVRRTRSTVP